MLREDDFEVVGYCKCGQLRYKHIPTGNIYSSCWCNFIKLKPRKFSIQKNQLVRNDNKCEPRCDCDVA